MNASLPKPPSGALPLSHMLLGLAVVLGTGLAAKLFILNHRGKGTTPAPTSGSGLTSAEGAAADAGAARPVKLTPIG